MLSRQILPQLIKHHKIHQTCLPINKIKNQQKGFTPFKKKPLKKQKSYIYMIDKRPEMM